MNVLRDSYYDSRNGVEKQPRVEITERRLNEDLFHTLWPVSKPLFQNERRTKNELTVME